MDSRLGAFDLFEHALFYLVHFGSWFSSAHFSLRSQSANSLGQGESII